MKINRLDNGRYQVRWRDKNGKQRSRNERTKELAQAFCRKLDRGEVDEDPDATTIGELIAEFKTSTAWTVGLDYPTQVIYGRVFDRWFDLLADTAIGDLDPGRISKWIGDLKANANRYGKAHKRQSFTKELNLLKSLLAWYRGYKAEGHWESPIRARHEDEVWLDGKSMTAADEDFEEQVSDEIPLTEEEFLRFREALAENVHGPLMQIMADVQFDHTLRACEAAALMWPDVRWDEETIKFQRHVQWVHQARGVNPDKIAPGLKNRKAVKRRSRRFNRRQLLSKTNPFFPRSTKGLRELYLSAADKTGFVFVNAKTGTWFTFRSIQNAYDRAFKRAGLPYSGTHIVRYGGVNHFMDEYGADEETAMDLLGNKSEGRYILRPTSRVHRAVKAKKPSASNVHSASMGTENSYELSKLDSDGGMDGFQTRIQILPVKTAQ